MATRLLPPGYQELTSSGAIASGAKLYTYSAGTSTPKASYSDEALTVPNSNPVVADGSGRFGDIFATTGQYKLVMKTSADVTLWTADPVDGASITGSVVTTDLTIQKADPVFTLDATSGSPSIVLDKAASGGENVISGTKAGLDRWKINIGNTTAEAGSNAGSDFSIARYSDAGALLGTALTIKRDAGTLTVGGFGAGAVYSDASGNLSASGGNWERLASGEVSVTSSTALVSFTLGATYRLFRFSFVQLAPTGGAAQFYFRVSTNNGTSYFSGAADYTYQGPTWAAAVGAVANATASAGLASGTMATTYYAVGEILFDPGTAAAKPRALCTFVGRDNTPNMQTTLLNIEVNAAAARATNIQFGFVSQNIGNGIFIAEGLRS